MMEDRLNPGLLAYPVMLEYDYCVVCGNRGESSLHSSHPRLASARHPKSLIAAAFLRILSCGENLVENKMRGCAGILMAVRKKVVWQDCLDGSKRTIFRIKWN